MPNVSLPLAELVVMLDSGVAHEELSCANGVPSVVVDLDDGPADLTAATADRLARLVTVTVGYATSRPSAITS